MKIRHVNSRDVGIEPHRPHAHIPHYWVPGRDRSRCGPYRDAHLIRTALFSWRPKK